MGGHRAASWLGGTGGVGKADFSRLQGSDFVLWPGADLKGLKAMDRAASKIVGVAGKPLAVDTSTHAGDR